MIKYELRCEICQTKFDTNYNIPKVLICGHTVCSKCVERMKEKNITKCPFDRKLIDFDEDKIANNYYILSLIEGSVKENIIHCEPEVEEVFELSPKPVLNNPGWKNTLDGFIKGDILFTIESNGFFYCTDLNTGEWWFLYLNQFWGKHFFQLPSQNKMYMIDQLGSLYQIFTKNYYTQTGKKNAWRNTSHVCIFNDKLYSIETSNKLYETDLITGKWREIGAKKEKSDESEVNNENINESENDSLEENNHSIDEEEFLVQNSNNPQNENIRNQTNSFNRNTISDPLNLIASHSATNMVNFNNSGINLNIPNILKSLSDPNMADLKSDYIFPLIRKPDPFYDIKDASIIASSDKNIFISNKKGEVFILDEITGDTHLIRNDFSKNIETYSYNSTHVYFLEKGGNVVYRCNLSKNEDNIIQLDSKQILNNVETFKQNDLKNKKEEINKKFDSDNNNNFHRENVNIRTNIIDLNSEELFKIEKFIELEETINPVKIIVDETRIILTDKKGELLIYNIQSKKLTKFNCLFMLRNCHTQNTILVRDGDLLILDPIRLSLNKLNIISGSETIILHSLKFLSSIKYIFSANSKIYFIDTSGSLFQFLEGEKKIAQIGNNGLCRFTVDFAVHKNFLFTIESSTLYKTNLSDGNFIEIKNEYTNSYKFFFADNVHVVFINHNDEIFLIKPEEKLKLLKKFYYKDISKLTSITYFKNHIIYYNKDNKSIDALNLDVYDNNAEVNLISNEELKETESKMNNEKKEGKSFKKVLTENFPDVSLFINNYDCLACISRDGVIYKLFC